MVDGDAKTVIIDNGSGMIKAGFAGDEAPREVFPSVVGVPRTESAMMGVTHNQFYVGEEAMAKKGVLKISYPVKSGKVENWDDMQKVWEYCFTNSLRIDPS